VLRWRADSVEQPPVIDYGHSEPSTEKGGAWPPLKCIVLAYLANVR
jgi:hypothetical protein